MKRASKDALFICMIGVGTGLREISSEMLESGRQATTQVSQFSSAKH
jgi:hypothetical protein